MQPHGAILTPEQGWGLAEWYADRLEPDWQRKTPDEARDFFANLGLVGDFWALPE